jgi:hypothetical protein
MNSETISTWQVLQDFGFTPDVAVISDVMPGLSFDFGSFNLSASCVLSSKFREVVLLTGWLKTPRTITEIRFEMPRVVKSQAQCAAWIVWNLDASADKRSFQPECEVSWLLEGRQNKNLLPWVAAS